MNFRFAYIFFILTSLSSCLVCDINNIFWDVPKNVKNNYSLHCFVSKPERIIPIIPFGIVVTNKNRKGYNFNIGLLSNKDSSIVQVNKVSYILYTSDNDTLLNDIIDDAKALEKINTYMIMSDTSYDIPILEAKELGDSIFVSAEFWFQIRNDSTVHKKEFNCTLVKDRLHGFSRFI